MKEDYIIKALKYYYNHKNHVLMKQWDDKGCTEPTEIEDIKNPNLWKGSHWNWLFDVYFAQ